MRAGGGPARAQADRATRDSRCSATPTAACCSEVKEELFFAIDERGNEADLTREGPQQHLRPDDPDAFVMPDLPADLQRDRRRSRPDRARRRRPDASRSRRSFDIQSETIHNISQLLRAYCLFEKDVQYVVQENKVLIVDEFTGRLMPGRRWSDGLHQAVEAKEGVQIERETQTLATITIQNYFRLYEKLAGHDRYRRDRSDGVQGDLQARRRGDPDQPARACATDSNDRIFKTQREKYNAHHRRDRGVPPARAAGAGRHGQRRASPRCSSRMLQRRHMLNQLLPNTHACLSKHSLVAQRMFA